MFDHILMLLAYWQVNHCTFKF